MMIRKNSLVLAAAFTGLLGGTMARLNAAPSSSSNPTVSSSAGQLSTTLNAEKEKHACEGKNSCKGKGGCKSTTVAKARTLARARAGARPMAPRRTSCNCTPGVDRNSIGPCIS